MVAMVEQSDIVEPEPTGGWALVWMVVTGVRP